MKNAINKTPMTAEKKAALETEWKGLKRLSKDELRAILKRGRRVSDLRGMTKMDLMNDIMHDRHGRRTIAAWVA